MAISNQSIYVNRPPGGFTALLCPIAQSGYDLHDLSGVLMLV